MRDWSELVITELPIVLHLDIRSAVALAVAVVGAGKGGDTQAVVLNSIALGADLMGPNDGCNIVELAPPAGDIGAKAQTDALIFSTLRGRGDEWTQR